MSSVYLNECSLDHMYDLIGVGFGPAGIALSVAMEDERIPEDTSSWNALFLDKSKHAQWQADMLLPRTDIQHNFLRDFVTPYNPRSHYTFVNYLKEQGRLFSFGLLGVTPGRIEWNDYVCWVARQLTDYVHYQREVVQTNPVLNDEKQMVAVEVCVKNLETGAHETYLARNLSINTGRKPHIPQLYAPYISDNVFHSTRFKTHLKYFRPEDRPTFTVVGSGQNAIEIMLYLAEHYPDSIIYSVNRNLGFRTYDLGQFSNEVYFPEFTDYFYELSKEEKQKVFAKMKPTNYSAVDINVSTELYWKVYEESILGKDRLKILKCTEIEGIREQSGTYTLHARDIHSGATQHWETDALILCTGIVEEQIPRAIQPLNPYLQTDEQGDLLITKDYQIQTSANCHVGLYANGITERTHGISDATSFSMMALKAKQIWETLKKKRCGQPSGYAGHAVDTKREEEGSIIGF